MKFTGRKLFDLFSLIIPVAIFIVIFRLIDLDQLAALMCRVNPVLLSMGMIAFPLIIIMGAIRWHLLCSGFIGKKTRSIGWSISRYWAGLAIGRFFPGSVTWDIYRVMAGKKRGESVFDHTIVILVEKAAALLTAGALICTLVLFIRDQITVSDKFLPLQFKMPHNASLLICITLAMILIFLLALLTFKPNLKKQILDQFKYLTDRRVFLPGMGRALIPCFLIYLFGAFANALFFWSLDYHLCFLIHLFLFPVFTILLLIPVSFGGIGVREGAYVLLYGSFGVPAEIAFTVAFMGFLANLVNYGIGGLVLFLKAEG